MNKMVCAEDWPRYHTTSYFYWPTRTWNFFLRAIFHIFWMLIPTMLELTKSVISWFNSCKHTLKTKCRLKVNETETRKTQKKCKINIIDKSIDKTRTSVKISLIRLDFSQSHSNILLVKITLLTSKHWFVITIKITITICINHKSCNNSKWIFFVSI